MAISIVRPFRQFVKLNLPEYMGQKLQPRRFCAFSIGLPKTGTIWANDTGDCIDSDAYDLAIESIECVMAFIIEGEQ